MPNSKKIWLTRPVEDSEHFAAELAYHDIPSLIAPVMHVVRKPLTDIPIRPDAILLTSRHAAHSLNELPMEWQSLPVYCVGASTANYAREYRFKNIVPGTSDIMSLLPRMIATMKPAQTLLYLSGEETRADIPSLLMAQDIRVHTLNVYTAVAEGSLPESLTHALQNNEINAVTFFSPRSAAIACRLLKDAGLAHVAPTITAYCLSLNVAQEAGALPWSNLHTCHTPTRRAMREMILSQRNKSE